jgi:hypothetical protein
MGDGHEPEDQTRTVAKTLWSETVLEILYESLRLNKDDKIVGGVLREVREKGFKRSYILDKVEKKVSAQAASRVRALMKG